MTAVAGVLACTAPAHSAPVAPGTLIQVGIGQCTAGFVVDGTGRQAGRVFVLTAAHCSETVGDRAGTPDGERLGEVVQRGFPDLVASGARGDDWALIEVDAERRGDVSAALVGHPGLPSPGFLGTSGWCPGDGVTTSGWGSPFEVSATTRERRPGALVAHGPRTWGALAPMFFGDSGGPVVHSPSGRAIGLVSGLGGSETVNGSVDGPSLVGIFGALRERGISARVRPARGRGARRYVGRPWPTKSSTRLACARR